MSTLDDFGFIGFQSINHNKSANRVNQKKKNLRQWGFVTDEAQQQLGVDGQIGVSR